jgi:hypothetical protein
VEEEEQASKQAEGGSGAQPSPSALLYLAATMEDGVDSATPAAQHCNAIYSQQPSYATVSVTASH